MRHFIEDDELKYGGLIGILNQMKANEFAFRHIWEASKHLYYYTIYPNQEHPYCDWEKMKRDIKRAMSDGYLTRYGKTSASRYVKTEKLLKEEFIEFQIH